MTGLSICGDPEQWLDIGYSISTIAARLETALGSDSAVGAQVVARSWYGPAADAFTVDWAGRKARYEELLQLAGRAARAITAYGHAILEAQAHARNTENAWCSMGLQLRPGGGGFMLPTGVSALPAPAQISLAQTLEEATRSVASVGAGVVAADTELHSALDPVIAQLDDFDRSRLSQVASMIEEVFHAAELGEGALKSTARAADAYASILGRELSTAAIGFQSYAGRHLRSAGKMAKQLDGLAEDGEMAGKVLDRIGWVPVALGVAVDLGHESLLSSLEGNAGNFAAYGTGLVLTTEVLEGAAAAVGIAGFAVPIAAAAAGVTVAVGVGYAVQAAVNHRQEIGHAAEDAAGDVGHVAKDAVGAVGHAAGKFISAL